MKNNNLLGIIGGILGAIIGSIPWVLMYVYGGYILSILAFLIAICSLKGYQIFGGIKTKNTRYLIIIFSVIGVTIATFILIPILYNLKNGLGLSIESFKDLYINNNYLTSIIGDYIISLLFTLLGISGVIKSLKDETTTNNLNNYTKDDIETITKVFKDKNALSKNNSITKWEFEKEIDLNKYKDLIDNLKLQGVIIGSNKLYLEEKSLSDPMYANSVLRKEKNKKIFIVLLIGLGIFSIILFLGNKDNNINNKSNIEEINDGYKEHKFLDYATYKLPDYLTIYEDNTNSSYYNENGFYSITYTPRINYRGEELFRTIFVDYIEDYYYDDFSEYKQKVLNSSTESYVVSEVNLRNDINSLEVIEIKAKGLENRLYYDYYIFYNNDSLFFEFISYDTYDISSIEQEINNVLNSVKYIKIKEHKY